MDSIVTEVALENVKAALLELETLLWQRGANEHHSFVLKDAVIAHGDGEYVVYDDNAVEGIGRLCVERSDWYSVSFDEAKLVSLDRDTAIISYRASGKTRTDSTATVFECKSMYMRENGRMRLAFHQHAKPTTR